MGWENRKIIRLLLRPYMDTGGGNVGGVGNVVVAGNGMDDDDPVDMIRHHHKRINRYPPTTDAPRPGATQGDPLFFGDLPQLWIGKHMLAHMRTDRDKIHPRLRVIVATQADRVAMMVLGVVGYGSDLRSVRVIPHPIPRWNGRRSRGHHQTIRS